MTVKLALQRQLRNKLKSVDIGHVEVLTQKGDDLTGAELLKMADELENYYREFDNCCPRSEGRAMLRRYARGQLGSLERKSVEPIADAEGVKPRAMQSFFRWESGRCIV